MPKTFQALFLHEYFFYAILNKPAQHPPQIFVSALVKVNNERKGSFIWDYLVDDERFASNCLDNNYIIVSFILFNYSSKARAIISRSHAQTF